AIAWFITGFNPDNKLGSGGTDVGLRWALIIALPAVAEIVQIIYGLSRARGQEVQSLLAGAPLVHLPSVGLFLLVYWAWLQPAAESGLEAGESWWRLLLWVLLVGGLWALCAWFFHLGGRSRRLGLSNLSTWLGGQPGALGDPRYVRLFDDATLFNAPTETQPTLDKRYYPSDRRPILRLWWEGPGELWVRSRRDHLEFGFAANPPANTIQRVLAPLGPMTLADFATYLGRAIREAANPGPFGGFTNKLKAEKHADVDWDYVLPAGLLFAAFGDDRDTVAAAQAANDAFQKLPVAQASAFVLHHIPRAHSSGRFGLAGPVDLRTDTGPVDGAGNIAALVAPNQVQGNAATRFWTFFRPGDRIRTKALATNETRVVTRVISDQLLELNRPFTAAVVAGTNYERLPDDRENDLNGPGSLSPGIDDFTLIGAGVDDFEAMLMPGDVLRITGGGTRGVEERTVVAVVTVRTLTIDRPLLKVLDRAGTTPPARYVRVGRRTLAGLAAVPTSSTDLFAGRSLLDHAADFAALLCLGGTTQMLIGNAERTPTGAPMIDRAG
ncbi:MAG: hypothetical protein KC620_25100, partial [Myxococcales bacterium]|nr:hypothetical protein [Myxococcales bacterium]